MGVISERQPVFSDKHPDALRRLHSKQAKLQMRLNRRITRQNNTANGKRKRGGRPGAAAIAASTYGGATYGFGQYGGPS